MMRGIGLVVVVRSWTTEPGMGLEGQMRSSLSSVTVMDC